MRRTVTVALAVALLSAAGCGTDGSDPTTTPGEATSPARQPISTEEFCEGDVGDIGSLTEQFAEAMNTYAESLPDLEPSDREELEALLDDVDAATQPLTQAYREVADDLADQEVAEDLRRLADEIGNFTQQLREAVLAGELGDSDPSEVLETAFDTMGGHCE